MLARLERLVLWAMALAALAAVVVYGGPKAAHWLLARHDDLAVSRVALGAEARARIEETAAATRGQAASARESDASFRAGLAAARLANPAAQPAGGPRPTMTGADLMNVVGRE